MAGRILRGDILLPKFQRDFVWEKHQIIDLLDSIANNCPIGSVLLWRSRELLRSERSIADLEIAPTQHDYPVNYLLDGQQRLSTICGALYWQGGDPLSRWNLAYDLRERAFLHLTTLDDPPLHHLRLNKLTDPSAYFKHVSSLSTSLPVPTRRVEQPFGRSLYSPYSTLRSSRPLPFARTRSSRKSFRPSVQNWRKCLPPI
ncbi:DUF262 domain-containing protein [Bradyrhizobium sp. BWA-3-5]|uniref:DUF262 domain-containing protein n=1 Tax=Bradyrhizobium sp. BWA-3-5 TaxID=3080013 RepID=UPI00397CA0FC